MLGVAVACTVSLVHQIKERAKPEKKRNKNIKTPSKALIRIHTVCVCLLWPLVVVGFIDCFQSIPLLGIEILGFYGIFISALILGVCVFCLKLLFTGKFIEQGKTEPIGIVKKVFMIFACSVGVLFALGSFYGVLTAHYQNIVVFDMRADTGGKSNTYYIFDDQNKTYEVDGSLYKKLLPGDKVHCLTSSTLVGNYIYGCDEK